MSDGERIEPRGLLPSEVAALRRETGADTTGFGAVFGVSPNVVERWEDRGVPSGPTALAIRLVADAMGFDFPALPSSGGEPCGVCGAPAPETFHGIPVCESCHRDPVASAEEIGWAISRTRNHVSGYETVHVVVPAGHEIRVKGRFMSEGLGTMLAKMYKEEPQLGDPAWDDAVYVQWVEPGLEELDDALTQDLLKSLVAYGVVEVDETCIDVQHAPNWGSFGDEIVLLSALLANRLQR